ncbi:MAG: hypothetical protein J6U54_08675 [Clostridiales bacterium]|nr:hypothetical protein [Clostridiales bacterium]
MKVVVSRDEIKQMISEKFGLTDFILEISSENAVKVKPEIVTTVNNQNQIIDVKIEKSNGDVPVEEPKKKKSDHIPTNTVVDYEKYALMIEEFLNSTGTTMGVDLEGLTPAGMEYRIRTAARMYGLNGRFILTKSTKYNEIYISKK